MRCLLIAGLALSGCKHRVSNEDPVPGILKSVDRDWRNRGDVGLDVLEDRLMEAFTLQPKNPEVLWRLVRMQVTRGVAEDESRAAGHSFAEGRALGMQCLDVDPGFAQGRRERGWSVAMERLDPQMERCAAWTALAWSRWIANHGGAAAALDLEPMDALLLHLKPATRHDVRSTTAWAYGLLSAVRPSWAGRDLKLAREQLELAISMDRLSIQRRADLYLTVLLPADAPSAPEFLKETLEMKPAGPDDAAALKNLKESTKQEAATL